MLQASLPAWLPLLSIGRCLHNHDEPSLRIKPCRGANSQQLYSSKLRALSRYTFCLVTENSAAKAHYTTRTVRSMRSTRTLPVAAVCK